MNKLTAAYLAGFVDGEGYVGIMKTRNRQMVRGYEYRKVLKIASTDKGIIDWLYQSFGGSTEKREWSESENNKPAYCWTLRYKNLEPFLRKIYPFLKIKKRQVEILLEMFKVKIGDKNIKHVLHSGWNRKYSKEALNKFEEFYLAIRQLNRRGKIEEPLHVERLSETTLRGNDSPSL